MSRTVLHVLAYDLDFASKIPTLFPSRPEMAVHFVAMPEEKKTLFLTQNSWLQAGYFVLAARALGLDCGPMLGFDATKVDEAFFSARSWRMSGSTQSRRTWSSPPTPP